MKRTSTILLGGLAALVLGVGLTVSAKAETTPPAAPAAPAGTSVAPAGLLNNIGISYANLFYGPAITEPVSNMQPDEVVGRSTGTSPLLLKNYLAVDYKLNPTMKISPVLYWTNNTIGQRMGTTLQDPYLKLSKAKLLEVGSFNLYADLRLAAPISSASRSKNKITALVSKQVSSFEIPDSRFSFGLTTIVAGHVFAKAVIDNKPQTAFEAYATPGVNYQILPNLAASLTLDMGVTRNHGADASFTSVGTYLDPSLSWDITPAVNFSPYLDIKTSNRIALDTTSYGFAFSWKLL